MAQIGLESGPHLKDFNFDFMHNSQENNYLSSQKKAVNKVQIGSVQTIAEETNNLWVCALCDNIPKKS